MTYRWSLAADSETLSYLFVVPDRTPSVEYGVMVTDQILAWIRQQLGLRRSGAPPN